MENGFGAPGCRGALVRARWHLNSIIRHQQRFRGPSVPRGTRRHQVTQASHRSRSVAANRNAHHHSFLSKLRAPPHAPQSKCYPGDSVASARRHSTPSTITTHLARVRPLVHSAAATMPNPATSAAPLAPATWRAAAKFASPGAQPSSTQWVPFSQYAGRGLALVWDADRRRGGERDGGGGGGV